jgi:hypothetical protein
MATKDGKVKMYLDHVKLRMRESAEHGLVAVAHQLEGAAKVQIVDNDQVDTGFMLNSVYVQSDHVSTYHKIWTSGAPLLDKRGKVSHPKAAPRAQLNPSLGSVAVVVGAVYAIYQEILRPFLRPAAQLVATQVKGIVEPVFKRYNHD